MTIKLLEIVSQLPQDVQTWIKDMNAQEVVCTEIILNNVGQASFAENWKVYRDDLNEIRNF